MKDKTTIAQKAESVVPPAVVPSPAAHPLPDGAGTVSDGTGPTAPVIAVTGTNPFRRLGGSDSHAFNVVLLRQVTETLFVPAGREGGNEATAAQRIAAAAAALAAFKPVDEIEGMLAGQAVALHYAAMECLRRSMLSDMPSDAAGKLRKDGANLARGMTDMIEALDRKRGKGPQVVRVERVIVNEGGQAVVGNVQPVAAPTPGAPGG